MPDEISIKEYVDLRFTEQERAVQAALSSAKEAVSKAEAASEKRFDAVNEFRATLADQQRNLMPRGEVEILIKSINEKIDNLNTTTISRQSQSVGQREGIGLVVAIASAVSIAVALLSKFVFK